jgi:di/tricarboxylate transporter
MSRVTVTSLVSLILKQLHATLPILYRAAPMEWQGWFTVAIVLVALAAMIREIAAPDLVLMAVLVSLGVVGILSPAEMFAGFANPVVPAIGALFAVSAGLRQTGALDLALGHLLGRRHSTRSAIARISAPVMALSAFLNNAPIVAMMTPGILDWARRNRVSPSRFLIPLSYSSILGSITTIIGTSTNLTVAGLILETEMAPMGFFELLPVGLPICVVGMLYLVLAAPRLLPDRMAPGEEVGERRREYVASMRVEPGCTLIGQSVETAGLRALPGLFLVEIDRGGRVITPVAPDVTMVEGDRLVFAGVVSTIVDLQRIRGLVPVPEEENAIGTGAALHHSMAEVVVSTSSPLVGASIREANFRTVYDAAVIGVHRNGERVPGKIGEIVLRPGDTLLIQCAQGFMRAHRNSPDFYLVSELETGGKLRYELAWLALAILVAMVASVATGLLPISIASFVAAGTLVTTRCMTAMQARASIDWSILVVIGAGLGIATAMVKTGAAAAAASLIVAATGDVGPIGALVIIYCTCLLMAELLHHNAAVAIMFPIAVATAERVGVDPRGFVMAVAIAGCCAFASPVTYQTHLIVYGPGGYRFSDFIRVGLPLDLLAGLVALICIPMIWPF